MVSGYVGCAAAMVDGVRVAGSQPVKNPVAV